MTRSRTRWFLVGAALGFASVALADSVIYDFEAGAQGWVSTGPITTDSGAQPYGAVGKGRSHVGDFDLPGWGMVDYSPTVNLSAYTGLRVFARLRNIAGYTPFSGTPTLHIGLAIGDAEWMGQATLSNAYQAFSFNFSALVPDGIYATAPITPGQLSDPSLVIKLKMYADGNSGIAAVDYDQVVGIGAGGQTTIPAGAIIYDFDDDSNTCYPDGWGFFGYAQTDFGASALVEDGKGAFQSVDWTGCDLAGYPSCTFTGSKVGGGTMHHPHCLEGGYADINLDLSLGTGLSVRAYNDITSHGGGTLGVRLQFQVVDSDGTTAVASTWIVGKPWINRSLPVTEEWVTYKCFFKGLDYSFDNGSSAIGTVPGINLNHITSIKLLWRRNTALGHNVFRFDEITLIDDPVVKWGDADSDGDMDFADFAQLQQCYGAVQPICTQYDANRDGVVDVNDAQTWNDGFKGPDSAEGFFPWCY